VLPLPPEYKRGQFDSPLVPSSTNHVQPSSRMCARFQGPGGGHPGDSEGGSSTQLPPWYPFYQPCAAKLQKVRAFSRTRRGASGGF
jgi:hypothetical protein